MFSVKLIVYCILTAGLYLLAISFLLDFVERKLRLTRNIPEELVEPPALSWTLINFVMESLFFVVIPTLVYSYFYFVIPFIGVRAGLAAALFAFVIGIAPAIMGLSVRVKLPMPYLLFFLFSLLVKMSGSLALIGYLYSL